MTIDDIEPDEICEMTALLDRAFRAVDCEPECHCCKKPILIGQNFKLAYIKRPDSYVLRDSTDEMLCEKCTPAKLLRAEKKARTSMLAYRQQHGGFTRKHRTGP